MPTRVLIVDDSITMRRVLRHVLQSDKTIEVVGEASNANEAREAIKRLDPDVLTLDIEMPGMNGLVFLDRLMSLRPMPVIMVSSLTQAGAENTMAALEHGAVDFVAKPLRGDILSALGDLPEKIKAAHSAKLAAAGSRNAHAPKQALSSAFSPGRSVIAIGASTGGVEALMQVLSTFPENCPPTLIVQHMPAQFTPSFASRLNRNCRASVSEAQDGAPLRIGHVYIAPGGERHLRFKGRMSQRCELIAAPPRSGHSPSVDVLFESIAELGEHVTAALLTGMGSDGAAGLKCVRDAGGKTIGQDEATSTVYGMPKVAFELGGVARQLPLNRIGAAILESCNALVK
jgi:two-component system, chemotaxis family, protein-glutamate methylesterase/glutaminase